MPDQPNKFYLTTPIYYVNARPHIGHAYTTIVGDVLARRHRLLGEEVYFLTGTDEHGQKIERSAAAAGIPPQQFTDQVSKTFSDLFTRMGITNDQFIRTTSEKHKRGAQHLFSELYKNGHIYLDSYTGQYCVSDETFVDVPVGAACPDCGRITETVTEENFFFKLSEFQLPLLDLIESNALTITPESVRNEVLSFLRGNFLPELYPHLAIANQHIRDLNLWDASASVRIEEGLEYLKTVTTETFGKARLSAAKHWYLEGALKNLSVSRSSFTWGIPVPEPAASASKQKHVIYVWLDALANYMTALGYGSEGFEAPDSLFNKFWPADLHLVGKEITRFHCVYWPAFLMAAGIATPKAITANGWLLFDNAKMSKSKGNVVRTETILEGFGTLCPPPTPPPSNIVILSAAKDLLSSNEPLQPTRADRDLFATDVLRYHLLREIPFGQDGSFSFEAMITRYNAELVNGYGNVVKRTLSLIEQNFSGMVPETPIEPLLKGSAPIIGKKDDEPNYQPVVLDSSNMMLNVRLGTFAPQLLNLWQEAQYHHIVGSAQSAIAVIDEYLSNFKPWNLAKQNDERSRGQLAECLYTATDAIRIVTATLYPILPYTTAKVWHQLGLGDIELAAANGDLKNLQWGGLKPGTKLGPLSPIFPRADKGLAQIMADLEDTPKTQNPSPQTESQTPQEPATTSPAAGPRTASLTEPIATLPVAGSTAHTTGPHATPSHTEAPASGIFANQPADSHLASSSLESPQITIDDFAKIELRVAEIKVAERIPKADKLLRLEVDLGSFGTRQILSGIAEFYTPEELIGRRIVVITNLAPRKMRGLESHGMLLAASDPDAGDHGKPHLATCGPEIALGSRLK